MVSWDGKRAGAAHVEQGQRVEAALEPGRQVPGVSHLARRRETKKKKGAQVWLLNRAGGEALQAHRHQGRRRRLRLVARQHAAGARRERSRSRTTIPRRRKAGSARPKPPIVIDRYAFKSDRRGYLGKLRDAPVPVRRRGEEGRAAHERRLRRAQPVVVARRHADRVRQRARHRSRSHEQPGHVRRSTPRPARRRGSSRRSPDRTEGVRRGAPTASAIAYLQGDEVRYYAYNLDKLAIIPSAGGDAEILTESLDRAVSSPVFSQGRQSRCYVTVEDDRVDYIAPGAGGRRQRSSRSPVAARSWTTCRSAPTATAR